MRHPVPAAFPLIGLIAGLSIGDRLVNPVIFGAGLAVVALLHRRAAPALILAIAGIVLALSVTAAAEREQRAFAEFDEDVFVVIEAPLERDWAEDETSRVLRASRFLANGIPFDAPIALYTHFEPQQIVMEADLRAEGFLRRNERGAYTMSVKSPRLLTYTGRLAWWHPMAWNRALANRLERHAVQYPDEVALAQALVLGRGERLTADMRESFRRGGTYHLIVFSGMQIAFAAGLLAALLRWLHRPRASDWLLLFFALLAPPFIGPTASVARASTGIGLYALSRILKRPTAMENLWCVAALTRLLIEPGDLYEPSFHLTYAGAGALLYVGSGLGNGLRRMAAHLAGAETVITPLALHHFHQYALGGSVLTLLISPLIFAMLMLSALVLAVPSAWVFRLIGLLHRLCVLVNAGGLSGIYAAPPPATLIAGGMMSLFAIAVLRERKRAVAILLAMLLPSIAAVLRSHSLRTTANPRLTFFDVGQGDAIAIRSGQRTILVDGGRDGRILSRLAERGIRRIDAAVLTHSHPDHCAGLAKVVEHFEVGEVWLSPRRFRGDCSAMMLEACAATRTPIRLVRNGDRLALDGITITAYVAESPFRRAPENNASILLRVEADGRRFLLTGDIEREAELYHADRDLQADVLKVAHHGSRSSTSESWLALVRPRLAVISCGRRNQFGHPHPGVLEALGAQRVRTWRTDAHGSIDFDVKDGRLYVMGRID